MEDNQSSVAKCNSWPMQDGDIDALDTRFIIFCKDVLSLDENIDTQAIKVFKETKHLISTSMSAIGSGTPEEIERFWFAFVLYSVMRLSEKNGGTVLKGSRDNPLTLCQILRVAKLNLADFFKELPQCIVKSGPVLGNLYGADWENRLQGKESQANFVLLSHLSKYYKRAYLEFFMTSHTNNEKQSTVESATGFLSEYYRFGWLLFLALRVHVFSHFTDLVTCTNGLVSILGILIIHVPVCFRNFNFHDSPRFVKKSDKGVDLIASLCNIYHTSDAELRKTMEKANNIIESVLKKKPCLASKCKTRNLENIDTDNLIYFEDLMEATSLASSLYILEQDYVDAIKDKGEVDERVFVNEDDSLLGSGSSFGGAWNMSGSKRKFDSIDSPATAFTSPLSPSSPASGTIDGPSIVATPVSTAMTTAKWLQTVISPLPSKPSAELEQFLASCDKNVSNDVKRRAHIILNSIFPSSALEESCSSGSLRNANLEDIWAEQRKLEALKLYYRVLEAMCRAETQVLREKNLTALLTNERFHRCMLACSAELVLATYKTVTMLFPAVLERTGITAFDLSKVIESFIRHEDSLPRELKRHLNSLEELLLESMVWEKGSSMYNSLIVARPALSAEINRLGLLAEPMPSLDAINAHINFSYGALPPVSSLQKHEASPGLKGDIMSPKRVCTDYRSALVERNVLTSPVKNRLLASGNLKAKLSPAPLQSAFASPARPNPGAKGETCAETGIKIFFSKIMKLAAVRVNGMVERLQQSQKIREDVYWLFQQILSRHTTLFFNRHIDQIILCCFYGVLKLYKLNLTFKEIVFNYRKQPHCKSQVFQSVFIDPSSSAAYQNGKTGQHVNIITFYNRIFLPMVKPLMDELKETSNVPEVNKHVDAQCPPSPKLSSFPNLPDMSPKKVSSVHNVYVSPLRSSKKDVLVSHSSKSYYACLGESTRPYQSPSKDLTAINNHLNSDRKLRGTLNFSEANVGLVSDSVVAKSLYMQYGNWASSTGTCLKSEQPEV